MREPASRTPEGVPNRCGVCGHVVWVEPSRPYLDAPCPRCGCLMWLPAGTPEALEAEEIWPPRPAEPPRPQRPRQPLHPERAAVAGAAWRRGCELASVQDWGAALQEFCRAAELDPENRLYRRGVLAVRFCMEHFRQPTA